QQLAPLGVVGRVDLQRDVLARPVDVGDADRVVGEDLEVAGDLVEVFVAGDDPVAAVGGGVGDRVLLADLVQPGVDVGGQRRVMNVVVDDQVRGNILDPSRHAS